MRLNPFRSVPPRLSPALVPAVGPALLAALLVVLSGCTSPSQTGVIPPTTASDTAAKERDAAPPAYRGPGQFQIPFGSTDPTSAELRAERQRQSTTQGLIPTGRVYLGSIPCETDACRVQRVTLTLLPDGRWRRVSQPLDPAGTARVDGGCWEPEPGEQPLIHLLSGHRTANRLATLRMRSPAVLTVQTLGVMTLPGRYTLNVQADTESIHTLQNSTSFYCPARS